MKKTCDISFTDEQVNKHTIPAGKLESTEIEDEMMPDAPDAGGFRDEDIQQAIEKSLKSTDEAPVFELFGMEDCQAETDEPSADALQAAISEVFGDLPEAAIPTLEPHGKLEKIPNTFPKGTSVHDIFAITRLQKRLTELHEKVKNNQLPGLTDAKGRMIILRPYQLRAMTEYCNGLMKEKKDAVFDFPTGAGKTVVFATLLGLLNPPAGKHNKKTLIVVPRIELLKQTIDAFKLFAPYLRVGKHGDKRNKDVVVTTYQSLARDIKREDRRFDFSQFGHIVLDEAHNSLSKKRIDLVREMKAKGASVLTFTATPEYNTKNKKLEISSVYELLGYASPNEPNDMQPQNPVSRITIIEAIDAGALAPVKTAVVTPQLDLETQRAVSGMGAQGEITAERLGATINKPEFNKIAVDIYANGGQPKTGKRFLGEQAVVFCAGIAHAEAVANSMKENISLEHPLVIGAREKYVEHMREKYRRKGKYFNEARIRARFKVAAAVHSKKHGKKNGKLIRLYKAGGILVLTGADKLTEGFDHKATSVVLNMRATKSVVLKKQSSGRGLRLDPKNPHKIASVIDWDWGIKGQIYFSNIIDGKREAGTFEQPKIDHSAISTIDISDVAPHSGLQWEHSKTLAYYKTRDHRRSGSPRTHEQREIDMMQTARQLEASLTSMEGALSQFKKLLDEKKPDIVVIEASETQQDMECQPAQVRQPSARYISGRTSTSESMEVDDIALTETTDRAITRSLEKRLVKLGNRVEDTNQQISEILALLFESDDEDEAESNALDVSDDELTSDDEGPQSTRHARTTVEKTDQAERLSSALNHLNGLKNKISSLTNWIQGGGHYAPIRLNGGLGAFGVASETHNDAEECYEEIEEQLHAVLSEIQETKQIWSEDNLIQLVEQAAQRREEIKMRRAQTQADAVESIPAAQTNQNDTRKRIPVDEKELLRYARFHHDYWRNAKRNILPTPTQIKAKGSLNDFVGGIAEITAVYGGAKLVHTNLQGANLQGYRGFSWQGNAMVGTILLGANLGNINNYPNNKYVINTPADLLRTLQHNLYPEMREKHKEVARKLLEGQITRFGTEESLVLAPKIRCGLERLLNARTTANSGADFFKPQSSIHDNQTLAEFFRANSDSLYDKLVEFFDLISQSIIPREFFSEVLSAKETLKNPGNFAEELFGIYVIKSIPPVVNGSLSTLQALFRAPEFPQLLSHETFKMAVIKAADQYPEQFANALFNVFANPSGNRIEVAGSALYHLFISFVGDKLLHHETFKMAVIKAVDENTEKFAKALFAAVRISATSPRKNTSALHGLLSFNIQHFMAHEAFRLAVVKAAETYPEKFKNCYDSLANGLQQTFDRHFTKEIQSTFFKGQKRKADDAGLLDESTIAPRFARMSKTS